MSQRRPDILNISVVTHTAANFFEISQLCNSCLVLFDNHTGYANISFYTPGNNLNIDSFIYDKNVRELIEKLDKELNRPSLSHTYTLSLENVTKNFAGLFIHPLLLGELIKKSSIENFVLMAINTYNYFFGCDYRVLERVFPQRNSSWQLRVEPEFFQRGDVLLQLKERVIEFREQSHLFYRSNSMILIPFLRLLVINYMTDTNNHNYFPELLGLWRIMLTFDAKRGDDTYLLPYEIEEFWKLTFQKNNDNDASPIMNSNLSLGSTLSHPNITEIPCLVATHSISESMQPGDIQFTIHRIKLGSLFSTFNLYRRSTLTVCSFFFCQDSIECFYKFKERVGGNPNISIVRNVCTFRNNKLNGYNYNNTFESTLNRLHEFFDNVPCIQTRADTFNNNGINFIRIRHFGRGGWLTPEEIFKFLARVNIWLEERSIGRHKTIEQLQCRP